MNGKLLLNILLFCIFLGEPERTFENLKKRYSKKRIFPKKLKRSGAGKDDVGKAEKELQKYAFLGWMDTFSSLNEQCLSNVSSSAPQPPDSEELHEEEYDEDDGLDEEGKMCTQKSQERQAETKMPSSLPKGIPKWKKSASPADDLLVTINKRMQERSKRSDREMEDDESIFGIGGW